MKACPAHPPYHGKYKPRGSCYCCWEIWAKLNNITNWRPLWLEHVKQLPMPKI
jgi:hypothetical protein